MVDYRNGEWRRNRALPFLSLSMLAFSKRLTTSQELSVSICMTRDFNFTTASFMNSASDL